MNTRHIENSLYRLEVDTACGRLVRLHDKVGDFAVISEPRLAENFRLLLPLPGLQANYILGSEQKLSSVEDANDSLKLHWAGPLHNAHGTFDLAVTLWIELVDESVQFRCEVRNSTEHQLAEVWYGMLGGITGLGAGTQAKQARALVPDGWNQWDRAIFTEFGSGSPQSLGLGVYGPEYSWFYPGHLSMGWMSLYNPEINRGLYYASYDPDMCARVLRLQLMPGSAQSRRHGDWPTAEELDGEPCGVIMNWTGFPYTPPGETYVGPPIVLRCHDGGWREAGAIYRNYFTAAFGVVDSSRHWLRRETAYLSTMFMLPEDNILMTFKDIPQWAKCAADHGLTSVMISGWQVGGHDRGYPQYEPDPRLGTWEELEAGVAACHELGLRVNFFVNIQTVDISTDWYKDELHKYEMLDPAGAKYFIMGWGMGTLGARKLLTKAPLYELSPWHPEVRELLVARFRRLAEIGADGLHLDKNFMHPLDFNPRLTTSPDRAMQQGMLLCVREILEACRAVNPEFCFSAENYWDGLLPYMDVFWWGLGPTLLKVMFPQRVTTSAVTQPYDYNLVNCAVLGADNIMVAPASWMRGMDYPPMQPLFRYIGEITRIRRELHDFVSRGELVDSHEPFFRQAVPEMNLAGTFADAADAGWTVFRNIDTGKRAAVLANLGGDALDVADLVFADNGDGTCQLYQPFEAVQETQLPVSLTIPAERMAFIVES